MPDQNGLTLPRITPLNRSDELIGRDRGADRLLLSHTG